MSNKENCASNKETKKTIKMSTTMTFLKTRKIRRLRFNEEK